jgi:hypothetical protein
MTHESVRIEYTLALTANDTLRANDIYQKMRDVAEDTKYASFLASLVGFYFVDAGLANANATVDSFGIASAGEPISDDTNKSGVAAEAPGGPDKTEQDVCTGIGMACTYFILCVSGGVIFFFAVIGGITCRLVKKRSAQRRKKSDARTFKIGMAVGFEEPPTVTLAEIELTRGFSQRQIVSTRTSRLSSINFDDVDSCGNDIGVDEQSDLTDTPAGGGQDDDGRHSTITVARQKQARPTKSYRTHGRARQSNESSESNDGHGAAEDNNPSEVGGQPRRTNPFKVASDGISVINPLSVADNEGKTASTWTTAGKPEKKMMPQGSLLPLVLSNFPHWSHIRDYMTLFCHRKPRLHSSPPQCIDSNV